MKGHDRSKLRVLHVIARMNVGGPAIELVELLRGINPAEVEQLLVTGWCDDHELDYLEMCPLTIEPIRVVGLGRRISLRNDLEAFMSLRRIIKEYQPHVVHTHTTKAGVLGRIAAKSLGGNIQVVHTYHGHLLYGYFGKIKQGVLISIERLLARISDRLICVGERVQEDLLKARIGCIDQYRVIRSGVNIGSIPSQAEARKILNLPLDKKVVAYIGRITKIKRPDRFLDVVKLLQHSTVKPEFVVAGGGELFNWLQGEVRTNGLPVSVLGWRDDVEVILAASDIILLTSDNEGTPLSIIQAGLAGVPCISTRVGSVPELMIEGVTGVTTSGDASKIASELSRLLLDSSELSEMGHAAAAYMAENFSVSSFVNSHRHLYSELCLEASSDEPVT